MYKIVHCVSIAEENRSWLNQVSGFPALPENRMTDAILKFLFFITSNKDYERTVFACQIHLCLNTVVRSQVLDQVRLVLLVTFDTADPGNKVDFRSIILRESKKEHSNVQIVCRRLALRD